MQSETVISRELMGKIVDEVFDGAIEDASVIEEIYAVIKREEAALSAAEPVGDIAGQQGRYFITRENRWSNWFDITFNTWVPEPGAREVRNVYAAPPAPSVAVKLEKLPAAFEVLDTENGTYLTRSEESAIASDYEYNGLYRRNGSALSAQVQDVAIPEGWQLVPKEPTREMCEAAPSLPAIHAIDDLPFKKSGWSMSAIVNRKRYLVMLAAAPAKQEGKP